MTKDRLKREKNLKNVNNASEMKVNRVIKCEV